MDRRKTEKTMEEKRDEREWKTKLIRAREDWTVATEERKVVRESREGRVKPQARQLFASLCIMGKFELTLRSLNFFSVLFGAILVYWG